MSHVGMQNLRPLSLLTADPPPAAVGGYALSAPPTTAGSPPRTPGVHPTTCGSTRKGPTYAERATPSGSRSKKGGIGAPRQRSRSCSTSHRRGVRSRSGTWSPRRCRAIETSPAGRPAPVGLFSSDTSQQRSGTSSTGPRYASTTDARRTAVPPRRGTLTSERGSFHSTERTTAARSRRDVSSSPSCAATGASRPGTSSGSPPISSAACWTHPGRPRRSRCSLTSWFMGS